MTPRRRVGVAGLGLAALGVAACVTAFTALSWTAQGGVAATDLTSQGAGVSDDGFSGVGDTLRLVPALLGDQAEAQPIAAAYFSWLGWLLVVAAGLCALAANLPTPAAPPMRMLGSVVALAAIGLSFAALDLFEFRDASTAPDYGDWLGNAGLGFWVAVAGFALAGIGSAIGAGRVR